MVTCEPRIELVWSKLVWTRFGFVLREGDRMDYGSRWLVASNCSAAANVKLLHVVVLPGQAAARPGQPTREEKN